MCEGWVGCCAQLVWWRAAWDGVAWCGEWGSSSCSTRHTHTTHLWRPALPPSLQPPDCFYWELQYRAVIPGQQPGEWEEVEVRNGLMRVEVGGLMPGTKYAFR